MPIQAPKPRKPHKPRLTYLGQVREILASASEPLTALDIAHEILGRDPAPNERFAIMGDLDMLRRDIMLCNSQRGTVYMTRALFARLDGDGRIGPQKSETKNPLWKVFVEYFGEKPNEKLR